MLAFLFVLDQIIIPHQTVTFSYPGVLQDVDMFGNLMYIQTTQAEAIAPEPTRYVHKIDM